MPRSFLLRRSVKTQDARSGSSDTKFQTTGYKNTFSEEAKRNGGFKGTYEGSRENLFWPNEENKMDTKGPYMYQSYIDGDMIKKNNDSVMKAEFLTASTGNLVKSQLEIMIEQGREAELNPETQQPREIPATTPGMKPVYRCEQCGKTFKTKYTLTIHLKMPSHTGARPFVCNICGKGFRLSSTLCRHKIIHTSDKPHKCHICDKAFNRSSTLKTHIRTHSEKKEFMCDVCGKGFHQKGNLRNHFLIHTGEKPYNCRLCNKSFNKLSNLKFHLHVHTDNTPYRCRYCKTAFTRRCDLKQHIRTMHGEQHSDQFDSDDMSTSSTDLK